MLAVHFIILIYIGLDMLKVHAVNDECSPLVYADQEPRHTTGVGTSGRERSKTRLTSYNTRSSSNKSYHQNWCWNPFNYAA